jgi:hypothetical protein
MKFQSADRDGPRSEVAPEGSEQGNRRSAFDLVLDGDVWPPSGGILRRQAAVKMVGDARTNDYQFIAFHAKCDASPHVH